MSESMEIQHLTKQLSSLVSALTTIISKRSVAPSEASRIKKTHDMTYHDFLQKVLESRPPIQVATGTKPSYRLQEDLQLLLDLSGYNTITNKSFEQIVQKGKINRTVEGLKSRYNEYLSKIGEPEMKKIVAWVEREGVEGYLVFQEKELKIVLTDPKEEKKEKKEESSKKRGRTTSLEAVEKKYQKKGKEGPRKSMPTNCKELNDILKLYSKMVNVPIKTLLERLDQVSGDFTQLDNFIQSKDSKLLWSAQEDDILRKGGVEVELLRKYRGSAVDARKKYLGIN